MHITDLQLLLWLTGIYLWIGLLIGVDLQTTNKGVIKVVFLWGIMLADIIFRKGKILEAIRDNHEG